MSNDYFNFEWQHRQFKWLSFLSSAQDTRYPLLAIWSLQVVSDGRRSEHFATKAPAIRLMVLQRLPAKEQVVLRRLPKHFKPADWQVEIPSDSDTND